MFAPSAQAPLNRTTHCWCFCFVGAKLAVPANDAGQLALAPMPEDFRDAASRHYLGRLGEHDCWAIGLQAEPAGWQVVPLRTAMMQFSADLLPIAARAAQVMEWDRAHRFCGVCGTPTEPKLTERARHCPNCQHDAYPRISPAMMALVWRPGEILLARSPGFAPGVFSALAGFVEPGESLEDCVKREVAEEVGVQIRQLQYYGSQSWPFPHSLMLAFSAEWVSGEIVPQPGEIEEAAWFPIDALPAIPPRFSISGHLIRDTVEKLRHGSLHST